MASCTYYVPAKLETERIGDTLSVSLAGHGSARWDPSKDSLIITCDECNSKRIVEHFYNADEADFAIPNSVPLSLTLYSMGRSETFTMQGTNAAPTNGTFEMHPLHEHHRRAVHEEKVVTSSAPEAEAPVKIVKKVSSVKVTALEGVAIYSDKTKTTVLKIVPQGTILSLLSKEGNLYSVSIDGQEGFVDAEAVTEQ